MKPGIGIILAGLLLYATGAAAGQEEFELCQGTAENAYIRAANCDLAIRLGGLSAKQMSVALYNRGQAYLGMKQPDKAIGDLDAVLKMAPDDSEALLARAIARRQLKQYDGALEDFNRLISLNHQPAAKIYLQRSMVYHLTGDKENALADLRKAKALDPEDPVISDRLWKTERFYSQQ